MKKSSTSQYSLVIGDLHLDDKFPGYLERQLITLNELVTANTSKGKLKSIIFLGDIFHYRKPSTKVLTEFKTWLENLKKLPITIYLLRGNHDSDNRSDDGLTPLQLFHGDNVICVSTPLHLKKEKYYLIPHYEDEEFLLNELKKVPKDCVVFGHFGFNGCIDGDDKVSKSLDVNNFNNDTLLGHIHEHTINGNICVVGTPWPTNFGESGRTHYIAKVGYPYKKGSIDLSEINNGIRYLTVAASEITGSNKKFPKDTYYCVKVVFDKFEGDDVQELIDTAKKRWGNCLLHIQHVFKPVISNKENAVSDFTPEDNLDAISDSIINSFLEENKSTIPIEELKKGLEVINSYENK